MTAPCSCPLCCFAHCSSRACNCLLLCTSEREANRTHKSRQCIHLHPQHLQLHTLAVGLCITPNAHYKLLNSTPPYMGKKAPLPEATGPQLHTQDLQLGSNTTEVCVHGCYAPHINNGSVHAHPRPCSTRLLQCSHLLSLVASSLNRACNPRLGHHPETQPYT